MEWQDRGIVLKQNRHGEHDAIITVLTLEHGRHLGLIKGGFSQKKRAFIEIGCELRLRWVARLADQLGRFEIEPLHSLSAPFLDDALKLKAILSCAALLDHALPEREKHDDLYLALKDFFSRLHHDPWLSQYVRWEADLLAGLGYGFDLSACAVTGQTEELLYVSPRSGRAVSKEGAGPYIDRLLALPAFLRHQKGAGKESEPNLTSIRQGLKLTGYFLEHHVFHHRPVPNERHRLLEAMTNLRA